MAIMIWPPESQAADYIELRIVIIDIEAIKSKGRDKAEKEERSDETWICAAVWDKSRGALDPEDTYRGNCEPTVQSDGTLVFKVKPSQCYAAAVAHYKTIEDRRPKGRIEHNFVDDPEPGLNFPSFWSQPTFADIAFKVGITPLVKSQSLYEEIPKRHPRECG